MMQFRQTNHSTLLFLIFFFTYILIYSLGGSSNSPCVSSNEICLGVYVAESEESVFRRSVGPWPILSCLHGRAPKQAEKAAPPGRTPGALSESYPVISLFMWVEATLLDYKTIPREFSQT